MSKTIPQSNFTVRHIWEAYAHKLLEEHPDWQGRHHNKIRNFYLYKPADKGMVQAISYTLFRRVMEVFFTEARKGIIYRGESIHLNRCGRILATRVQRNHRRERKVIDWAATRKQPLIWKEEVQRYGYARTIYFTNDDYCLINWLKNRIHNVSLYSFEATRESSSSQGGSKTPGFKQEFSQALTNNKLLKFKYLYATLTHRRKQEEEPEDA